MTIRSRDYLKARFETDDTPSSVDFGDLIDSFLLVSDDFITHEDDRLSTAIVAGGGTAFSMPTILVHDDEIVTET